MRVLSMDFTAATTARKLTIENDCNLEFAHSRTVAAISTDPTATLSQLTSPTVDKINKSTVATWTTQSQLFLDFPLKAGEAIYVSVAQATSLQLYFDV
jgi:hypothetical protein